MRANLAVATPFIHSFRPLGGLEPEAVELGRLVHPQEGVTNKIRYGGERHIVVLGANGSGKGTRIIQPNLLQMSGARSVVVVDPKGELAATTAPFRRRLGRVVILNPFGVLTDWQGYEDLRSHGFNPLKHLDPAARSFNSQCSLLADSLITLDPKEPHWDGSARALIAALIMYTVIEAKARRSVPTLARVRELLCMASDEPHKGNDFEGVGIPKLAREMMRLEIAGLRNKASQFADWNREIQSIASTAKRHTESLDDPEISDDLSRDGFDFAALKREPVTVYLILPPEMMDRHSKWLRLILTSALNACMRPRQHGEMRVLFILDEFFALGHLEIISTTWALVRGYGIQIMPVLQDLNQLKKLYPDMWETFLGMAGAVVSFAPNDLTTAEWLSKRCGQTTRTVTSRSTSISSGTSGGTSQGTGGNGGSNSGWSQGFSTSTNSTPTGVPLITSHQLMGLHSGFLIVMTAGLSHVIPAYAPAYYQIEHCAQRARANPFYLGS